MKTENTVLTYVFLQFWVLNIVIYFIKVHFKWLEKVRLFNNVANQALTLVIILVIWGWRWARAWVLNAWLRFSRLQTASYTSASVGAGLASCGHMWNIHANMSSVGHINLIQFSASLPQSQTKWTTMMRERQWLAWLFFVHNYYYFNAWRALMP